MRRYGMKCPIRTPVQWSLVALVAAMLFLASRGFGQSAVPANGLELMSQGRFEEALPVLEAQAAANPGDPKLAGARVGCLLQMGRWNEALAASEKLIDRFPTDPQMAILRGDCLFLTFQPARAVEAYGPGLSDPRWGSTALSKAATAALAHSDQELALSLFRQARERGIPLTDAALQIEFGAEDNLQKKLAILNELISRNPEAASFKDQLALDQALAEKPPAANLPPPNYPSRTRIKEIYREPSIPVKLMDGQDPVWVALDTGSESLLLNEDLIKKLALPDLCKAAYGGWGYRGLQETRYVYVARIEAAGRVLTGVPAIVNTRDAEFWTKKGGYVGLWPFLKDVAFYDRRGGVFALWPAGTAPSQLLGEKAVSVPALWYRGLCLVPVSINGGEPHPFLLDTGAPYSLLDKGRAARIGVRVNSGKYRNVYGLGFSGAFASNVAESLTIEVGGRSFIRRTFLVTDIPQLFPVPLYGIIGRDLLNEFKLVFDGPGARVAFKSY